MARREFAFAERRAIWCSRIIRFEIAARRASASKASAFASKKMWGPLCSITIRSTPQRLWRINEIRSFSFQALVGPYTARRSDDFGSVVRDLLGADLGFWALR